jgi:hypothetical protein
LLLLLWPLAVRKKSPLLHPHQLPLQHLHLLLTHLLLWPLLQLLLLMQPRTLALLLVPPPLQLPVLQLTLPRQLLVPLWMQPKLQLMLLLPRSNFLFCCMQCSSSKKPAKIF